MKTYISGTTTEIQNPDLTKGYTYNRMVAANKEKADDLMTILGALPPGQVENLLKDEVIGPILKKYGISEQ